MNFLHTQKFNITFLTSEFFSSMSADRIIQELYTVASMYTPRGFNISVYQRDNKFGINDLQ